MLGWSSEAAACASRSKRSTAWVSAVKSLGKNLSATTRLRRVSSALKTDPMPPEPMGSMMR